ncbi:MAG: ADP-ribosylglycohydrolase family protein, partial [Cellulophaga baltica]
MIKEILLGIAIGDAFGAGVEFQDRDWIRQHVDFSKFVNARDQIKVAPEKKEVFTKNYTAWEYTDDTEMTIGLINALNSGE